MALASALDLRSPADSELPGRPVDKLAASLFGGYPPQHCIILPPDQTVGPKTKTQLLSERQVWRGQQLRQFVQGILVTLCQVAHLPVRDIFFPSGSESKRVRMGQMNSSIERIQWNPKMDHIYPDSNLRILNHGCLPTLTPSELSQNQRSSS